MNHDKAIGTFSLAGEQAKTLLHPPSRRKRAASLADGNPAMRTDSDGFVCIHRKIFADPIARDPMLFKIWVWCIAQAAWRDHDTMYRMEAVHLKRGQFIFGRHVAAKELGCSEQSLRTRMAFLEKTQNLTITSTNRFSLITVLKYDDYQLPPGAGNQQVNQQPTSNQPASNQQVTSNQPQQNTYNNGKKGNTENTTTPPPAADVSKDPPKEKSLHTRTIDYFCRSWKTLYGSDYPFSGGKDAAHVKKLLDTVKEPAKVKATIDAYLACREDWFVNDRHSLGMLVCKLTKFMPVGNAVQSVDPKTPPSKYAAYMPTNAEVEAAELARARGAEK